EIAGARSHRRAAAQTGAMIRRVLSHAASHFDRAVGAAVFSRRGASQDSARAEALDHDGRMRALEEIRALYERPEHYAAPASFFTAPEAIDPRLQPVRALPGRGEVVDAFWRSRYDPFVPQISERYLAHGENRTAAARL